MPFNGPSRGPTAHVDATACDRARGTRAARRHATQTVKNSLGKLSDEEEASLSEMSNLDRLKRLTELLIKRNREQAFKIDTLLDKVSLISMELNKNARARGTHRRNKANVGRGCGCLTRRGRAHPATATWAMPLVPTACPKCGYTFEVNVFGGPGSAAAAFAASKNTASKGIMGRFKDGPCPHPLRPARPTACAVIANDACLCQPHASRGEGRLGHGSQRFQTRKARRANTPSRSQFASEARPPTYPHPPRHATPSHQHRPYFDMAT